jgi:hypothetical protein
MHYCKLIDYKNHYDYLNAHFSEFVSKLKLKQFEHLSPEQLKNICSKLIVDHGDKAYQYQKIWENKNIHFYQGVAIYLLTYEKPFSEEVRKTENGWIDPCKWVIENRERFIEFLT